MRLSASVEMTHRWECSRGRRVFGEAGLLSENTVAREFAFVASYTARMKDTKLGSVLDANSIPSLDSSTLVRFTRPFEKGAVMGYILAAGPCFFLLALVDDNIRFNGFQCFRLQDVRNFRAIAGKKGSFIESALRLRGLRKPRCPRVNIQSTRELLETAGRLFPLITIYRERIAPDVCHIGIVMSVSDVEVSLLKLVLTHLGMGSQRATASSK
jgi:hypothetical protein